MSDFDPGLPPLAVPALRSLVRDHFQWAAWEMCIERRGLTIDRPAHTAHPDYPSVIYPLDYGFINDTMGSDGAPIDVFVGGGSLGLVGTLLTTDHRQKDREMKLLYDCTPPEIYTAHGFINYDRTLLEGELVLRTPMPQLWAQSQSL